MPIRFFLMLRCCLFFNLLCCAGFVRAEAPPDSSQFTSVVSLPPSFIGETDPVRQMIKGLSRLEENRAARFSGTVFDARPFLEKLGIEKIDSVEAVYFLPQGVLLLRGPRDRVEEIEGYMVGLDCNNPSSLKSELILASFQTSESWLGKPAQSYEELRAAVGDSWRELAKFEINSKTGMRAEAAILEGNVVKDGLAALPPGALGSIFEIEPVVGADGVRIDVTLAFQYRGKPQGLATPVEVKYAGMTTLWNGRPQILQVSPAGDGGRLYALLLRTTMVWPSTEQVGRGAP